MKPDVFTGALIENGFGPLIGVPCSIFKHLINYIEDSHKIKYYTASSEGEAMGLAGGFALSGRLPVVLMQSDGYGNAINPISSLQLLYKLPCLLLISWRGEPGKKDAPQHLIMGRTIKKFLSIFEIRYSILDDGLENLHKAIKEAEEFCKRSSNLYALLIRKGYFESYEVQEEEKISAFEIRISYLNVLKSLAKSQDVMIGTTGFSGREMQHIFEHEGKFYMMGSMGCAASIGLAIAKENPYKNIFILDGDGALLMKMGVLSTIGHYATENLLHICFDNNQYESTGGQKTSSVSVDFTKIAKACGYNSATRVETLEDFKNVINKILKKKGPHFIRVIISPGTIDDLPRPVDTPEEMKLSLMRFLKNNQSNNLDKSG